MSDIDAIFLMCHIIRYLEYEYEDEFGLSGRRFVLLERYVFWIILHALRQVENWSTSRAVRAALTIHAQLLLCDIAYSRWRKNAVFPVSLGERTPAA